MARTPRNYEGTEPTGRLISALLPGLVKKIGEKQKDRPDLVLAAWPVVVGQKLSAMTEAVSFDMGVLTVKVKNSTLLSLLVQHEKMRLLQELRNKFPKTAIQNIIFRIG